MPKVYQGYMTAPESLTVRDWFLSIPKNVDRQPLPFGSIWTSRNFGSVTVENTRPDRNIHVMMHLINEDDCSRFERRFSIEALFREEADQIK
ncbi:MAG: hypothetical protein EOP83_35790 [Verrucomicrobiaceae bacterium]|nr:MAG: hypothetical protein EOP83_35790 [Verrucomicrobiaceae bacterium]